MQNNAGVLFAVRAEAKVSFLMKHLSREVTYAVMAKVKENGEMKANLKRTKWNHSRYMAKNEDCDGYKQHIINRRVKTTSLTGL